MSWVGFKLFLQLQGSILVGGKRFYRLYHLAKSGDGFFQTEFRAVLAWFVTSLANDQQGLIGDWYD